jgi:thiol-disulfide isomerase/thioredoxin
MRNRGSVLLFVSCLCALGIAAGCASSDASSGSERPRKRGNAKGIGAPMPSLVVKALKGGRKIDLGSLHGKVVLVDIWASWCAPCLEEMPLLDDMAVRLKPKGVEIIAVSVDEDKANVRTFLESRDTWSLTVAFDPKGKVPEVLNPPKMPSSYIVDAEGILRYVNEGFERNDIKKIEDRLTALAEDAS